MVAACREGQKRLVVARQPTGGAGGATNNVG